MKLNFKKILSFSICMLALNSAHAYKFVLFTDDTKTQKADQIAELMKNTYPFTKFDIEVEIVPFTVNDDKERISNIMLATAGSPIMSQLEGIQELGYSKNASDTLSQIKEENRVDSIEIGE